MSFAVVKFINEGTDSEDEVVSEVPVSWLVKDNKFCKWPIDNKYASIYISKNQPPQSQWKEFPVEVEYFCDSLAEAKLMMKGEEKEEKVGRGFRKLKPTYYFSPAEEDERTSSRIKKKNPGIKKGPSNGNEIMNEFMRDMNANIELVQGTVEEQALTPQEQQLFQEDTDITQVDDIIFLPALKESNDSSGDGKLDTVLKLLTQLEGDITSIKNFLGNLKLDMNELKQTINEKYLKSDKSEIDALKIDLPVKSLNELEQLEILVMNNKEQKSSLFEHLKRVGGNDAKDFTVRICRFLFTNNVGELCSMTGRKNNYPIGRLELVDMAFGVVHQKSKCTRKEFEEFMSEWLRHSKQRRLREENKNAII